MDLDHAALRTACFEAARKTLADARPMDVEKISRLGDAFYALARQHFTRLKERGRDPQILVRAAAYLAHTHAIPPMHDGTEWFMFMMRALVELACPDVGQPDAGLRFFDDLEEGIMEARRFTMENKTSG